MIDELAVVGDDARVLVDGLEGEDAPPVELVTCAARCAAGSRYRTMFRRIDHNSRHIMSATGVGARELVQAWGRILSGHRPNLSIEITKECPLRCPGCYAYGDEHLGGDVTLRGLADYKGDELVARFMALIDRHQSAARLDRRRRAAGAGTASWTRFCRSWPSEASTRNSSRAPCVPFHGNGAG